MKTYLLKFYLSSLLLVLFQFSFSQNVKLKTGDILFQSMNCGPLCEAINEVTEGYQGKDFSHLGMVYIKNDSIFVIEAAGKAVKLTPYETFKTYTNEEMRHKLIPNSNIFHCCTNIHHHMERQLVVTKMKSPLECIFGIFFLIFQQTFHHLCRF